MDLASPVKAWLRTRSAIAIGEEIEGDFGIADLVAGFGDERRLRNRRRQSAPVTSGTQLALLLHCATWRSEAELRSWAPHGFSGLKQRAINPLVERGLLRAENGRYRSVRVPKDPFDLLVAVELKLRDAARGVEQARTYRLFADLAYLAMPAARLTPAAMDSARRFGVGVLAVHPNHVEEIVVPTMHAAISGTRRRLASERVLRSVESPGRPAGSPIR